MKWLICDFIVASHGLLIYHGCISDVDLMGLSLLNTNFFSSAFANSISTMIYLTIFVILKAVMSLRLRSSFDPIFKTSTLSAMMKSCFLFLLFSYNKSAAGYILK